MASQSTGIQQLLAAEKKSAEKVAEARKRKYIENPFVYVVTARSTLVVYRDWSGKNLCRCPVPVLAESNVHWTRSEWEQGYATRQPLTGLDTFGAMQHTSTCQY